MQLDFSNINILGIKFLKAKLGLPPPPSAPDVGVLGLNVDGGGAVITTGVKGGYLRMPYDGYFTGWTILADQAGSVVVDVWKADIGAFPPTVADTITNASKPTLAAQQLSIGNVTSWTDINFTENDVFAFNVDSAATITQFTIELATQKT